MTTTNLLNSLAVARRSEAEAATLLQAYIATGPQMAQNHVPTTPQAAPQASAAAPQGPGMGPGGGGQNSGTQGFAMPQTAAPAASEPSEFVVGEYEGFKNGRNALAFFFYRQPTLDETPEEGPFWFTIQGSKITAGAEGAYAVFEDVDAAVIAAAKQRGVILLVEFENAQPYRCTPCYLSDRF